MGSKFYYYNILIYYNNRPKKKGGSHILVTVTMLPFMYYKIHNKIQLAKNQCHTANISIERHVEAASCCYDGHQNGRGLYGCLPSNAGRSCNSLRRLRQARICRRISCGCVGVLITLQRYEKSERNANKNAFIFISERTSSSTNVLRLRLSTYGAQEGTTFFRNIQENTRQFIILSGLIWTQVDRSGQRLRQLSYLCIVNPERQADGARFTPQRRRISQSAEQ